MDSLPKFRGLNTKGEFVYGSLVVTTNYIQYRPHQHSKTWIITSSFGNGGWFNIQQREYVRTSTVGQFSGIIDDEGTDIYAGDVVHIAGYGKYLAEFPFYQLVIAAMESDIGKVLGNIHQNPRIEEE